MTPRRWDDVFWLVMDALALVIVGVAAGLVFLVVRDCG